MEKNKKSTFKKLKESRIVKVLFARKSVVFCMIVLLVLIFAAIFAPLVAPYDPNEQNLSDILQGVSSAHLLSTDNMGRDILSRIIYGGRVSFIVGLVSVFISGAIGMVLGLIAGTAGKFVDSLIMRIMDAMMSIPMIILALFLGAIFGTGLGNICLALGISAIPAYARVTRGQVLTVKHMDYVTAGTLCGASKVKNTFFHILPNCISANLVLMTMNLGSAILNEAALSFLGMGINPPTASWGAMVNDGYRYISSNPVISIAPGIFIMIVVLCFNMIGDALRDAMDPKLRGTLGNKKRFKARRKSEKTVKGEA